MPTVLTALVLAFLCWSIWEDSQRVGPQAFDDELDAFLQGLLAGVAA